MAEKRTVRLRPSGLRRDARNSQALSRSPAHSGGAETGSTCVIKIRFVSVRDTVVIRSSIINANDNVQTVAANDNVYVAAGAKIAA